MRVSASAQTVSQRTSLTRDRAVESLEARVLLSSNFPNVDISQLNGNQAEAAIAIDRNNPSRLFSASNIDFGDGLFTAVSSDSGASWTSKVIADGSDHLDPACCDPSSAFDQFGNLYLVYLNAAETRMRLLLSTDGGRTFDNLTSFEGRLDQPTVVSGAGQVWVMFSKGGQVSAGGASVSGLGQVGEFGKLQNLPGSKGGQFGDVAIGSAGQVMVAYQRGSGESSRLMMNVDPDGVGPQTFGARVQIAATNVGGFLRLPAQPRRGIDVEASLGFDRSGGAFNGRAYVAYTDRVSKSSDNTDTLLRYSDDNGAHWSNAIRVNDDSGRNTQMLPRLAVDDTSGAFAISWYDARNDRGLNSASDSNALPNDDVQLFATVGTPVAEGVRLSPNQQVSEGTSNASRADNGIDLGDYTGLDFFDGVLHPAWADNSNSTGDDPGNTGPLDIFTASAAEASFAPATATSLGGLVSGGGPAALFAGKSAVRASSSYKFKMTFSSPAGVDPATITGAEIVISGPGGASLPATLLKVKPSKSGSLVASYRALGRAPDRSLPDAGTYTLSLVSGLVKDLNGSAANGGIIGNVVVG